METHALLTLYVASDSLNDLFYGGCGANFKKRVSNQNIMINLMQLTLLPVAAALVRFVPLLQVQ